jgi:hypothetical protein
MRVQLAEYMQGCMYNAISLSNNYRYATDYRFVYCLNVVCRSDCPHARWILANCSCHLDGGLCSAHMRERWKIL